MQYVQTDGVVVLQQFNDAGVCEHLVIERQPLRCPLSPLWCHKGHCYHSFDVEKGVLTFPFQTSGGSNKEFVLMGYCKQRAKF